MLLVSLPCGAVVRPTRGSYSVLMSASVWLAGVGDGAADAVVVPRRQLRCAARERTTRTSHEATATAAQHADAAGGLLTGDDDDASSRPGLVDAAVAAISLARLLMRVEFPPPVRPLIAHT